MAGGKDKSCVESKFVIKGLKVLKNHKERKIYEENLKNGFFIVSIHLTMDTQPQKSLSKEM